MSDALRACDLCYARKVRCDRQKQCANCTDAGTECNRTRVQRCQTKASSMISSLGERVLCLERTVSERLDRLSTSDASDSHRETNSKKRGPDQTPCSKIAPQSPLHIGSTTHYAEKARAVIQEELKGNERMDYERQSILKSALQFVDIMARGRDTSDKSLVSVDVCSEDLRNYNGSLAPSPELFYMLLSEPTATTGRSSSIQWPDHISDRTLQKMATTILSGHDEDHGQVFYQYCVCVYVKAIFHLFQKPRAYKDPRMREQFLRSVKRYEVSAYRALNKLNFLNAPTLPFIQSLISAAFLMRYLGNMSHSWILNSYAARLIVALDYHEVCNSMGNSELDKEIHSVVCWCFYLDRTLSTLLYRPMSLPELHTSPVSLISDESLPHTPLVRILLELAQVQGELLDCGKVGDTRQILANHSRLQDRMEVIHSRLESTRTSAPDLISRDWIAGDFCYYSILVDILRSRLKYSFSSLTHKECVSCSRKSLKALHHLQKNMTDTPGADPYPSFFTWTALLYLLSPFFVLFCNVIGELDMEDYSLLQNITQSLSQCTESPSISKLLRLLETLQNLCIPLIQAKEGLGPHAKVAPWYPAMRLRRDQQALSDQETNMTNTPFVDTGDFYIQQLQTPEESHRDAQMMWQLFNSQLSLEWFESDRFLSEYSG